ncbi:MAG: phosphoenolpyruvate synthase [Patescibacteria group bacterium]|nr:phosphoenolpyruvate synthase [Patescibacteria group bacterium]
MLAFIYTKKDAESKDLNLQAVGGKAFNLFKMAKFAKVAVPPFFVISTVLYKDLINEEIRKTILQLKTKNLAEIETKAVEVRKFFLKAKLSLKWQKEILKAYQKIGAGLVAVRSSATCEDLEEASFAGQQDTYLNIKGEERLFLAVKQCLASLFTVRAIVYRNRQGIDHLKAALSIVVQQMVESKVSGVAFSVEPTSGFDRVVRIDTAYGLGEAIVQGAVNPDTFLITKDGIIIQKEMGAKNTSVNLANSWSVDEAMVKKIGAMVGEIEKYYGHFVDVEFALDKNNRLWTLQVRPETKWQIIRKKSPGLIPFSRAKIDQNVTDKPVIMGLGVSPGAASGKGVFLDDGDSLLKVKQGDILMAKRTDPDMVPAMQVSGGVVTAVGGRTSHAAIVSRELGVPAVVGTENLKLLKSLDGKILTIDGDSGMVFGKKLNLIKDSRDIDTRRLPKTRTRVGLILADVNQAFRFSKLADNEFEVGLLRAEFMLGRIAVHPRALDEYDSGKLKKKSAEVYVQVKEKLLKEGFKSGQAYFIDKLARGMAAFGQAFAGRSVIYRTTDYKTNEYKAQLIGGNLYEPDEDNPMLGNRGTGRYLMGTNIKYLGWELQAMDLARTKFRADNLELMLPFVRTLTEATLALKYIKKTINTHNLKIIAMSEIPSNVLMATEFIKLFDGFSIGSNDMTQLVLGVDRDNQTLQSTYDEHDPAVVMTLLTTIFSGLKASKKVGFCGQGVSDSVIIAGLVSIAGITSVSVVADRYLQTKELLASLEKKKIKVKDLGQWVKQQFKARLKNGHQTEKDKIYAALNWDAVVLNALYLGGFKSFAEVQKKIDKASL